MLNAVKYEDIWFWAKPMIGVQNGYFVSFQRKNEYIEFDKLNINVYLDLGFLGPIIKLGHIKVQKVQNLTLFEFIKH